jgi:hypothetical protein
VPTVTLDRRATVPLHQQIATQIARAIRCRSTGPVQPLWLSDPDGNRFYLNV